MTKKTILFILTFIFFLIIDLIWINLIAKSFYLQEYGPLLQFKADGTLLVNFYSAFAAYFLLVLGVICFALPKAASFFKALLFGGLFGLIVYGVYDFTNLALLRDWSMLASVVDMLWGAVVCGLTCAFAFLIKKSLKL